MAYTMVAPQIFRVVQRLFSFPRRKVMMVAAALFVAGGGVAYVRTGQRSPHHDIFLALNRRVTVELFKIDASQAKNLTAERKPKQGGIINVRVLAALLLQRIGSGGLNQFIALATVSALRTALSNRLAKVQGCLFRAAFLTRVPLFTRLITENLILCFVQSLSLSTTKYLTASLSLRFREILTNRIHSEYFQNMTYYKMSHGDRRISGVEQRIASDVPRFSVEMSELVQENLSAIFDVLFYTWRLCSYASPKYAFSVLGYVIGAGVTIEALSPPFGMLMYMEQQLEGEYHQLHSRLRTHSESIAFYGGQDREASIIAQQFRSLVRHLKKVLHTQWWFGMIQDFVLKYLGSTFGLVLIIEPFFSGTLRPDVSTLGRAQMLSLMRYHSSVIISLFQAMGTLASNIRKLGRLSGYADRIYELMSVSREFHVAGGSDVIHKKRSGSYFVEAPYIEFDGVKVVTPTGSTLVENLTLKVMPGSNLLITGPNGSGKSSLFRVLGGLWPLVEGRISKPGIGSSLSHEIFYVPQRPYTLVGTLRDQLIYPLTSAHETQPLSAEGMQDLLRNVDLEYLLDRYPQDQEVNWGDMLSLGEQQRLGMARLFYHRPIFAILDECTSAVTTDMEERFCAQVRAMGMSCVTISHRPGLVAFHDIVLSLDGEGGWTVHYTTDSLSQPRLEPHDDRDTGDIGDVGNCAHRESDASTVKQQLLANYRQAGPGQVSTAVDAYAGSVLAISPPRDPLEVVPAISGLQIQPRSMLARISSLFKILVPTLSDKQGGRWLAVALLVLGRTWVSDRIADLNGTSVKYLLQQDKAAFVRLVGVSILQSGVSSFLAPSLRHMTATLALAWRHCLTVHLSSLYFQNYGFYKAVHLASGGTNDADQRITQDVEKLSGDLSGLVTGMIKPFVDILWFTYRMKVLTGFRGVRFLYAYMFLGLGFLRAITPDFGALTSKEQQLDGAFRFIHSRLRTHAESVAFFGGGSREQAVTAGRFKALLAHSQNLLQKRWLFGIADDFITKQLPHNVTWGLSLMYALEHNGSRGLTSVQGELAHDLRFLASVVSQSFLAFGDMLELYRKFLELSGGITRVSELNEMLIAAQNGKGAAAELKPNTILPSDQGRSSSLNALRPEANQDIVFEDVNIVTPGQKMLARKLTMIVPAGKSLLVTGPNGSGKSSLFRVLGGLWPAGSGHIAKPGQLPLGSDIGSQTNTGFSRDIFYVPQRPYTALGTLRDQIIYPLSLADAESKAQYESQEGCPKASTRDNLIPVNLSVLPIEMLDRRLRTILEDVRLVYLLDREGGWDACANWEDMLSLGEQQRLGMARLFFHHPKFGILDECTNATSVDVEDSLYKKARALGISVVTISQRPALIPYHAMELRLIDGDGGWELRSIQVSNSR